MQVSDQYAWWWVVWFLFSATATIVAAGPQRTLIENELETLLSTSSSLTPNSQSSPFVELFMLEEANKWLNKQTNHNFPFITI